MIIRKTILHQSRPTQAMGDYPNKLLNEAIPVIQAKQQDSLLVNPVEFVYFQQLPPQQRCPCFGRSNDTPNAECISCFGTGVTGGYEKYRCKTHMLVCNTEGLETINVLPDFSSQVSPPPLSLLPTALRGSVSFTIQPHSGIHELDLFDAYCWEPPGSRIVIWVKNAFEGAHAWREATQETLFCGLRLGPLQIKVTLGRPTPTHDRPWIKGLRLRYRVSALQPLVRVNIPLFEKDKQIQDLGIWEAFQSIQVYLDTQLSFIRNQDFFWYPKTNTRWRVKRLKRNDPGEKGHLSWYNEINQILSEIDPLANFPVHGYSKLVFGENKNVLGLPDPTRLLARRTR